MGNLNNALQQLREERKQAQSHVEKLDQAISVIESLNGPRMVQQDNAVGCQQEGLSLERCTGVNSGVGAVGTAEARCFSKT